MEPKFSGNRKNLRAAINNVRNRMISEAEEGEIIFKARKTKVLGEVCLPNYVVRFIALLVKEGIFLKGEYGEEDLEIGLDALEKIYRNQEKIAKIRKEVITTMLAEVSDEEVPNIFKASLGTRGALFCTSKYKIRFMELMIEKGAKLRE